MKSENGFGRKLRYGAGSLGITAGVLAAVLLLNILVTALCSGNLWFTDLTAESNYRVVEGGVNVTKYTTTYKLMDETKTLLNTTFGLSEDQKEGNGSRVEILFCADPDILIRNDTMRPIYYTAQLLEKKYPDHITVKTVNVWDNPSAVDDFRTTSFSGIYPSNVILSSGTEFRVYSAKAFYTYDTDATEPWAYNAEKAFVRGIMAVTMAESPICCLTTNHGEPFATEEGRAEYSAFLNILKSAGYEVRYLDLATEEIPENCRLILTFDPKSDFSTSIGGVKNSEIEKLDKFLGKAYSYMIFADADTPVLKNLEEFLEEWGISFNRHADGEGSYNYLVNDGKTALDGHGQTFAGTYVPDAMGGSLTKDIRELGGSPKVVFSNAIAISYSQAFEKTLAWKDSEEKTDTYYYGSYYSNGVSRGIYDIFRASDTAYSFALGADGLLTENGDAVKIDTLGNYSLMTLTMQSRTIGEGKGYTTVNDASYVCAVGSVDFASNKVLLSDGAGDAFSTTYGNTDVLLSVLRQIQREVLPVGIQFKTLHETEMDAATLETFNTTVQTVILTLIPLVLCTVSGLVILIKRRFRHS